MTRWCWFDWRLRLLVKLCGEAWVATWTSTARYHWSDWWIGLQTCELLKWEGCAKQFGQVRGTTFTDFHGMFVRFCVYIWSLHSVLSCDVWKFLWMAGGQVGMRTAAAGHWWQWTLVHWLLRDAERNQRHLATRTGNRDCRKLLWLFYGQTDPGEEEKPCRRRCYFWLVRCGL